MDPITTWVSCLLDATEVFSFRFPIYLRNVPFAVSKSFQSRQGRRTKIGQGEEELFGGFSLYHQDGQIFRGGLPP